MCFSMGARGGHPPSLSGMLGVVSGPLAACAKVEEAFSSLHADGSWVSRHQTCSILQFVRRPPQYVARLLDRTKLLVNAFAKDAAVVM